MKALFQRIAAYKLNNNLHLPLHMFSISFLVKQCARKDSRRQRTNAHLKDSIEWPSAYKLISGFGGKISVCFI